MFSWLLRAVRQYPPLGQHVFLVTCGTSTISLRLNTGRRSRVATRSPVEKKLLSLIRVQLDVISTRRTNTRARALQNSSPTTAQHRVSWQRFHPQLHYRVVVSVSFMPSHLSQLRPRSGSFSYSCSRCLVGPPACCKLECLTHCLLRFLLRSRMRLNVTAGERMTNAMPKSPLCLQREARRWPFCLSELRNLRAQRCARFRFPQTSHCTKPYVQLDTMQPLAAKQVTAWEAPDTVNFGVFRGMETRAARDSKRHCGHDTGRLPRRGKKYEFFRCTKMFNSISKRFQVSLTNAAMEHSVMALTVATEEPWNEVKRASRNGEYCARAASVTD